ncbi:MaoC family dehydratase N-terminal domain-containing protein [Caballeronia sp. LZ035]|uniref:FAS1-like dehydratase domain-containing protein n=1 Tax=Caballeronia sp. LZ035 TaxID=3038568 RepID=UPI002865A395|nr:MaoC family dehydratase N-terminal domain-containing protein [Caballeronia sp. LZ035]MDR5760618.1 MaoC family dehydratase N-terminal domain-containing protein [Caballeronia sp. LZ035]
MSEIDRAFVGTWSEPFHVDIEAGAIRKFARAIGDANPLFHDAAFARTHGYPDVVAPPTFPTCFRAPAALPWIAPLDFRRIVAGEIRFDYTQPLVAGLRLECRTQLVAVDERNGSKGTMQILRQSMTCTSADGIALAVVHRSTIYRSAEQVARGSLA